MAIKKTARKRSRGLRSSFEKVEEAGIFITTRREASKFDRVLVLSKRNRAPGVVSLNPKQLEAEKLAKEASAARAHAELIKARQANEKRARADRFHSARPKEPSKWRREIQGGLPELGRR